MRVKWLTNIYLNAIKLIEIHYLPTKVEQKINFIDFVLKSQGKHIQNKPLYIGIFFFFSKNSK